MWRATSTLALCALLAVDASGEQHQMSAPQLVSFIRSSIQLRQEDRDVADVVKRIKLSSRLNAKTVEDLEGSGAGPRTVAALKLQVTASANLPDPLPPAPQPQVVVIPAPDPLEQKRVLAQVTQNALS